MNIYSTELTEVKVIEYESYKDNRGFSYPIHNRVELEKAGIDFPYDYESVYHTVKAGTLYGIHFQNHPKAQTKLLYCIQGRGLDYAVDLRKDSPTYLKWVCVELSADNRKQIYIPKGFGHAFLSLEDHTCNVMRYDEPFYPEYSRQIAYNDPTIGITYPIKAPILAQHDVEAPLLKNSDVNL